MFWFTPTEELVYGFLGSNNIIREDGRIEQLCQHGVGHPVGSVKAWKAWMSTHGCDGCCGRAAFYGKDAGGARIGDDFEFQKSKSRGRDEDYPNEDDDWDDPDFDADDDE